jgi:hypothetical protein
MMTDQNTQAMAAQVDATVGQVTRDRAAAWKRVKAERVEAESTPTVKVRVAFTVEVDREAWAEDYGTDTTTAVIRSDVRMYFLNAAQQSPAASGGSPVRSVWVAE